MKKKNIIITFLVGVTCIMAIAYASFSQTLNITGSAAIDSTWNIKITNVSTKNIVGDATKAFEPVVSDTSVTFKTNLIQPGDSMTYSVTITNAGTIDAKVGSIEKTESQNPAIIFSTTGINENDLLKAGETQTFDVTVAYNQNVTSQPEEISKTLTVKLNYVQNS